jgi:hypothetical protein
MDTVKATIWITCNKEGLDKEIEFYNSMVPIINDKALRMKALRHLRYYLNDPDYKSCPQNPDVAGIVTVTKLSDTKREDSYRLGSYIYHNRKISWYPEKRKLHEKETL